MNKKFSILLFVGILILVSSIFAIQNFTASDVSLTGTPADTFTEEQRSKYCGTGDAKSNDYVKEYKIPTACTLPQAIVADPEGNIWFIESNTGSLAKFDPVLESFTEYENTLWPENTRSMMWGIDYAPDGTILFTDEKHNSIWKFNILNEEYHVTTFPSGQDSLPQKLKIQGSKLIVNDFKGNRLAFLDYIQSDAPLSSYFLPSNNTGGVTADFIIKDNNLWYTSWGLDTEGMLVKVNKTELDLSILNRNNNHTIDFFPLPSNVSAPNGITSDNNGNVWLADSSSSIFVKFDPTNANFTQYITSSPPKSTYGNYTGEIKSPISRPYWIDVDSFGNVIFNEQGSNQIGVFDPNSESLVEYSIPSKNPNWGDCGDVQDCGIAHVFDFVISNNKVWFTEWAENNLGVLDTTIPIPIEILLSDSEFNLHPGETSNLDFTITSNLDDSLPTSLILTGTSDLIYLQTSQPEEFQLFDSKTIPVTITTDNNLSAGTYKILLGAETEQISVSKYVTVNISDAEA